MDSYRAKAADIHKVAGSLEGVRSVGGSVVYNLPGLDRPYAVQAKH